MDQIRRNLLLGAGALGGTLGGAALTSAATRTLPFRETPLLSTYVAGTAYYGAAEAAASLRPRDRLALQREHGNDYDLRAIVVRTRSGTKLGYVPRIDNQALASLMDAGFRLTARVSDVVPDARRPDIRLAVFMSV